MRLVLVLAAAVRCVAAYGAEPMTQAEEQRPADADRSHDPTAEHPPARGPSIGSPTLRIPTLRMPTLGGGVLWGDVLLDSGYRIQHRVGAGDQYRLLSPADLRMTGGTLEQCREALVAERQRLALPPQSGEVVILIHGILRSSKSMSRIKSAIDAAGLTALRFDYPSTQVPIVESAGYLRRVIDGMGPEVTKIHVVVHSMGGLVMRTYLREAGDEVDPRLGRMVMIGVPNKGANLADMFGGLGLFNLIFGPAGRELSEGDAGVAAALPTPAFEFAVIAGSRGTEAGFNLLVPGDDDGTVAVNSTRLPGACDFMAVRGLHSTLMYQQTVVDATVRFLETGCLHETGQCDPVAD